VWQEEQLLKLARNNFYSSRNNKRGNEEKIRKKRCWGVKGVIVRALRESNHKNTPQRPEGGREEKTLHTPKKSLRKRKKSPFNTPLEVKRREYLHRERKGKTRQKKKKDENYLKMAKKREIYPFHSCNIQPGA